MCNAAQACVECVDQAECTAEEVCVAGACTTPAATCFDGAPNAGETGVDCGGPCPPCANGLGCLDAGDCQSGFCNGVCAACTSSASCSDGTWCGWAGACIPRSGDGAPCSVADECTSGSCVDGVCCDDPCNGTCSSCRATDTGLADGLCAAILVGADPDSECAEGECVTGACDGQGQCGFAVGQCPDLCQESNGSAYLYSGACYQGECAYFNGYSCGEGYTCNAELNGCEKL